LNRIFSDGIYSELIGLTFGFETFEFEPNIFGCKVFGTLDAELLEWKVINFSFQTEYFPGVSFHSYNYESLGGTGCKHPAPNPSPQRLRGGGGIERSVNRHSPVETPLRTESDCDIAIDWGADNAGVSFFV
jgi:hypothetical protein